MTSSIGALRRTARELLEQRLSLTADEAALDCDLLLSAATGRSRANLLTHSEDKLLEDEVTRFQYSLDRRIQREPIAYILGRKEFWGLSFYVTPEVLIPRPETELLVERAVSIVAGVNGSIDIVDVGVGSGAILLSVAHELLKRYGSERLEQITFRGVDLSLEALAVAKRNAAAFGLERYITLSQSDLLANISPRSAVELSLVLSNPPYVATTESLAPELRYEPPTALFAGEDGLEVLRRLIPDIRHWRREISTPLVVGLIEIGSTQGDAVISLARSCGIESVEILKDLGDRDRVVELRA